MAAPFAALESRLNQAVFSRLANTTGLLGLLETPVDGIFDAAYALGDVGSIGFDGSRPAFTLPTSELEFDGVFVDPVGTPLVIGDASYTVVAHQPDGAGVSVLVLQKADA